MEFPAALNGIAFAVAFHATASRAGAPDAGVDEPPHRELLRRAPAFGAPLPPGLAPPSVGVDRPVSVDGSRRRPALDDVHRENPDRKAADTAAPRRGPGSRPRRHHPFADISPAACCPRPHAPADQGCPGGVQDPLPAGECTRSPMSLGPCCLPPFPVAPPRPNRTLTPMLCVRFSPPVSLGNRQKNHTQAAGKPLTLFELASAANSFPESPANRVRCLGRSRRGPLPGT